MKAPFPFSAIVGQDELKLALLSVAIDPSVGGVLIFGDRGTGKSTAVRALSVLLPPMQVIRDCRYGCDPAQPASWCSECRARPARRRVQTLEVPVPVVDMPLGAAEDAVVGALNLEKALSARVRAFSRVCWHRQTAAFCTSMRSTFSRIIWWTF